MVAGEILAMRAAKQRSRAFRAFGFTLAAAASAAANCPVVAQEASLEGSWSGSGRIDLSTGNSERATCRASFSRQSSTSYAVSAVCATPSARVSQSGVVRRVGANHFAGTFHNSEYNVSGSLSMTARGSNRLSVSLSGGGASANLELRR